MRTRRSVTALALVALALVGLAGPATAGGTDTRWVDDDGKAGPGGCGGGATAFKKIQKAIDASGANDTIIVCPGDYTGDMVVPAGKDGLTIVGASPWTATIRRVSSLPTAGFSSATMLHIRAGANDVRIQHLVFVVKAPRIQRAGIPGCGVFAAIWVEGRRAEIVANRIRVTGMTYGKCALFNGIVVGDPSMDVAGSPAGGQPASALVSHNSVRDFVFVGIRASGPQTTATIQRNSIRFWHLGADFNRQAARSSGAQPSGFGQGSGIEVHGGAEADVYGNEISSGPDAVIISGGALTPAMGQGIVVAEGDGSSVRQNTIQRTGVGIWLISTDDGVVRANVTSEHIFGIYVEDSDDNRVTQNQVTQGQFGIYLRGGITAGFDESENNRITDNTAFSHEEYDCLDETTGDGTSGTANTWLRNVGGNDSPPDICDID